MIARFLDVDDITAEQFNHVLDCASVANPAPVLQGKSVAMLFQKPSLRTRHSFEMAAVQLGAHPVYINAIDEVGLGVRESVADVARTLMCYHSVIGARVLDHSVLEKMADVCEEAAGVCREEAAGVCEVPVINLLSGYAHPMQALADALTLRSELGVLRDRSLAYVGDANNVARSLCLASACVDMPVRVASPDGYGFDDVSIQRLRNYGCDVTFYEDPSEAVRGANAVYTDVSVSMGSEDERERRRVDFADYKVDAKLMRLADPKAIFLHCLPAHRGEEVSSDVLDGPSSRVWVQAANRMHAARGLLIAMFEDR